MFNKSRFPLARFASGRRRHSGCKEYGMGGGRGFRRICRGDGNGMWSLIMMKKRYGQKTNLGLDLHSTFHHTRSGYDVSYDHRSKPGVSCPRLLKVLYCV